jgi:hypothetical protein
MGESLGGGAAQGRRRSSERRKAIGRVAGLAALLAVVGLPLFSDLEFLGWDGVPVDGFAATTAYRRTGQGPVTQTFSLYSLVGHNEGAGNQYQVHDSSPLQATYVVTYTTLRPIDGANPPTITNSVDLAPAAGGCCAAPHAVCNEDGTCITAFTGSDGRFRELTAQGNSATSAIIEANARLSATLEPWIDGIVATTSDVAGGTIDLYQKPFGGTSYTPAGDVVCDPPTTNMHWATVASPVDDWTLVACRNGGPINLTQVALPAGANQRSIPTTSAPAPTAFRYLQLDFCGNDTQFPNQSFGPGIALVVPRNTDTVVMLLGEVGNAAAPQFVGSTVVSGTANDYFGMTCDANLVTVLRADPDGTGLQTVYIDFGDLSGAPNLLTHTDDSVTPGWLNTAPDHAVAITNTGAESYQIDSSYRPIVFKTGGSLNGTGQVAYGSIPTMLFFDGFESGDTRFWDTAVNAPQPEQP